MMATALRSNTLTVIIQAVLLQEVDDIEFVCAVLFGFLYSEIIPLCMAICVHVCSQYQLIFMLTTENNQIPLSVT